MSEAIAVEFWPELLTNEPDFELLGIFADYCDVHGLACAEAVRWLYVNEKWPYFETSAENILWGGPYEWWKEYEHISVTSRFYRASVPFERCTVRTFKTLGEALTWFIAEFKPGTPPALRPHPIGNNLGFHTCGKNWR